MSDHHIVPKALPLGEAIRLVDQIRNLRRFVKDSAELTEEFARHAYAGWPSNAASRLAALLRDRVDRIGLNLPGDELLLERLAIVAAQVDRTAVEMLDAAERKLIELFRSESPRPTSSRIEFRSLPGWQRNAAEQAARDAGARGPEPHPAGHEFDTPTASRPAVDDTGLYGGEWCDGAYCYCGDDSDDRGCVVGEYSDDETRLLGYLAILPSGSSDGVTYKTAAAAQQALIDRGFGPPAVSPETRGAGLDVTAPPTSEGGAS